LKNDRLQISFLKNGKTKKEKKKKVLGRLIFPQATQNEPPGDQQGRKIIKRNYFQSEKI